MTRLLHLDSSAAREGSVSRRLGRDLVLSWLAADAGTEVVYRDLDVEPVAFVSDTWIAAAFRPATEDYRTAFALSRSETLIRELEQADVLVIGAPMYNLGIPASLKAWIDQVVRVERTFRYGDGHNPPVGLLTGKRAIVIATSGGDAPRYEAYGMDFRTSYLRTILAFVGITDVEVVTVSDTMGGEPDLDAAGVEIARLVARYAGCPALTG